MNSNNKSPPKEAPIERGNRRGRHQREIIERDMGDALRSVYDRTVKEEVPDEFLDLLSKLD